LSGFFILIDGEWGSGIVYHKTNLSQLNNSYLPVVLCIFVSSRGSCRWTGPKTRGIHPPIIPCRSWLSSMKVFNLLFIMPVKDVPSLLSLISLALRAFAVGLAYRTRARVCICVLGWIIVYTCMYSRAHACTRQNARLRACWGLRSVSLCACTCSRVRGAALTVRREVEEDGNDDDGGCHGSKSTSV